MVQIWTKTRGPAVTFLLVVEGQDEEESTWLRPWSRTEPEVDLLLWKVVEFSPMSREAAALSNLLGPQQERRARSGMERAASFTVGEPSLLARGKNAQVKATLVLSSAEMPVHSRTGCCDCFPGGPLSYTSTRSVIYRTAVLGSFLGLSDSYSTLEHLGSIFTQR